MNTLIMNEFVEKGFEISNRSWKYNGQKPCVIDFMADWCLPCKTISPILEQLEKEYGNKIDFFTVNVDEQYDFVELFLIKSVPTLVFCPGNGKKSETIIGSSSKQKIEEKLKNLLPEKSFV